MAPSVLSGLAAVCAWIAGRRVRARTTTRTEVTDVTFLVSVQPDPRLAAADETRIVDLGGSLYEKCVTTEVPP
jgi:hypothetical protein